jgi:hypothetical protein
MTQLRHNDMNVMDTPTKPLNNYYNIGCKYNWVVPLGTTSRNGQGTKFGQIIFMGPFLKIFY